MEDSKDTSKRMKTRIKCPEYDLHMQLGVVQINKASAFKSKRKKKQTKKTRKLFSVEIFYFSLQGRSVFFLLCHSDLFCNTKLKFAVCLNAVLNFIVPRRVSGMSSS